jgi:small conductance mechanosensitive channel
MLMVLGAPAAGTQNTATAPADALPMVDSVPDPGRAVEEATGTIRDLWLTFQNLLPKVAIALGLLLVAAVLSRVIRAVLRRLLRSYSRAEALSALAGIGVWIVAVAVALSVIAGDVRTLLGSIGLVGLALSWALQTPIESFTGWLLNSFRGYYRVGDRIAVGDVFGDVAAIDFLTTTVWEAGGHDKPVRGEQPTGALITFPNAEILRASLTNYTRDFPFVWDEVTIGVSNDSDLRLAMDVMGTVAARTIGEVMTAPAERYVALLREEGLQYDVAIEPQVYASPTESWMDLTVRYLVPARERRRWSTSLHVAIGEAFAAPGHRERIFTSYPRRQVQVLEGRA